MGIPMGWVSQQKNYVLSFLFEAHVYGHQQAKSKMLIHTSESCQATKENNDCRESIKATPKPPIARPPVRVAQDPIKTAQGNQEGGADGTHTRPSQRRDAGAIK